MKKSDLIPKAFDPSLEKDIYSLWEKSGYFSPEKAEKYLKDGNWEVKKPFVMTLPPPNANGRLHLGHTCGYSFQDAMGRFNRMSGRPTLLLAGKDHASIQTEAVFTKILVKNGEDKWEMGREEFYKRCYDFCMDNAENARSQEKRIGLSADWARELFTLDPRLNEVIYESFFKLLEDGLIYRGKYIVNQCPSCRTALADVDTVHEERPGIFAYIIYPFVDKKDNDEAEKILGQRGIVVATTRPETMLGDTAVAVNPNDERYKSFIGKKILLPFVNREIPVIGDEKVSIETGAGALKVTPAHSPIDFAIGKEHGLEVINVIDAEGKMTGPIPERFVGMETIDCSKALVKELDEMGLLIKIERIKHEIALCERCGTPIQPIISNQWFINMNPLAKKAIEALDNGDVKVIPDGQGKSLRFFFENIQPWCISRQLWWGQRIPIWYSGGKELYDWMIDNPQKTIEDYAKETGKEIKGSGKIIASIEKPASDPDWNGDPKELLLEQESDILDTWFSSGQWPYSTLGGLNGEDFKKYYPTDVMETMRDILFWWVARMMMLGIYRTGKAPFSTVFLHGMIMAPDGSKMSKSKGNGIEPEYVFNKYGADALRLWYYTDALPGSNSPLREEKIKGNRNFVTKVWNASRFVLMNVEDAEIEKIKEELKSLSQSWKDGKLNKDSKLELTYSFDKEVRRFFEEFKFHLGAEEVREFFWHSYCDKWIEETKNAIKDKEIGSEDRIKALGELVFILKRSLMLMHPFMPYVTEAIWQELVKMEFAEDLLVIQQF